ncbi:MAG: hypothetical protein ACM3X6_05015 [Patescibacteria group bacterium]
MTKENDIIKLIVSFISIAWPSFVQVDGLILIRGEFNEDELQIKIMKTKHRLRQQ